MHTLQLLEQSLVEVTLVDAGSFKRSGDRILAMLDSAHEKLSSLSRGDTLAYDAEEEARVGLQEIAKTIDAKARIEQPETYAFLRRLGRSVPQPRLIGLLERTIARLRAGGI